MKTRPQFNLLYLHSHDTGRSIQAHGCSVRTPHLQTLAESGCLFRQAYCTAPTCSPSRAGLLTGETSHQAGMVALAHRGGRLSHPERHLASFLVGHGYETVLAGFEHVGPPDLCGYTRVSDVDRNTGQDVVNYATNFLESVGTEKPFFLDVGFMETHRTEWVSHGFNQERYSPHDGDGNADYVAPPAALPDTPETRRDWLDFQHAVERLDGYYGQILATLDAAGLTENTLIVATTDHGIAFPLHKCSLTSLGTGVFFILRLPGGAKDGMTSDALVSHLDFYPTVCDLLKLEAPSWLQGKSLLPILRGDAESVRDTVFAEVTFHAAFEPKRSARNKDWNYIRNFAAPHTAVLPNCDDGHSKRLLMEKGWAQCIPPVEELYDLHLDPDERINLAADPGYKDILGNMRERLRIWMQQTDDPLLDPNPSVIPLPQTVNTWDQQQPGGGDTASTWDTTDWDRIHHSV